MNGELHDTAWHDMTWHDMTYHDMTRSDVLVIQDALPLRGVSESGRRINSLSGHRLNQSMHPTNNEQKGNEINDGYGREENKNEKKWIKEWRERWERKKRQKKRMRVGEGWRGRGVCILSVNEMCVCEWCGTCSCRCSISCRTSVCSLLWHHRTSQTPSRTAQIDSFLLVHETERWTDNTGTIQEEISQKVRET